MTMVQTMFPNFEEHAVEARDNSLAYSTADYMLYPQYWQVFEKTVPPHVAAWLKKRARELLDTKASCRAPYGTVSPEVKEHWEKVARGWLPFGYRLQGTL